MAMRAISFSMCLVCALAVSAVSACTGGGGGKGNADDDDDDDGTVVGVPVALAIGDPPIEGIDVTIHDPAGLVVEHVVTDAFGTLELDVPEGGSFAVYYKSDGYYNRDVLHVLAPAANSQWSFPFPEPTPYPTPTPGCLDLTLSPAPPEATQMRAYTPCGLYVALSLTVDDVPASCPDGATTVPQVLALATSVGGNVHGWGVATDVAVTPGGGATPLTIDATNTDFEQVTFRVSGIPVELRSWTQAWLYTDHFEFHMDVENLSPGPTTNSISLSPPSGITARAHAFFVIQTDDENPGEVGEEFGAHQWESSAIAIGGTSQVAEFTLARVTMAPPDLTAPARPALSWTRGAGGVGAVGYAEFEGVSAISLNNVELPVKHVVLFDPTASGGALVLPEVPEALVEWRLAPVSDIRVTIEETGDRAARVADWVHPQIPQNGVYRFARGRYEVP